MSAPRQAVGTNGARDTGAGVDTGEIAAAAGNLIRVISSGAVGSSTVVYWMDTLARIDDDGLLEPEDVASRATAAFDAGRSSLLSPQGTADVAAAIAKALDETPATAAATRAASELFDIWDHSIPAEVGVWCMSGIFTAIFHLLPPEVADRTGCPPHMTDQGAQIAARFAVPALSEFYATLASERLDRHEGTLPDDPDERGVATRAIWASTALIGLIAATIIGLVVLRFVVRFTGDITDRGGSVE